MTENLVNVKVEVSAIVDEGGKIGAGSKVSHFAHICAGAVIGENVSLGQNVFVGNHVTIGDRCKIQNNVSVCINVVTLEDDVFCPSMVFTLMCSIPRAFIERTQEYKNTSSKKEQHLAQITTIICGFTIGNSTFIGVEPL